MTMSTYKLGLGRGVKNGFKLKRPSTQYRLPNAEDIIYKHCGPNSLGCSKISPKREADSTISLSQETRKVLNAHPKPTPKGVGERTAKKPKPAGEEK